MYKATFLISKKIERTYLRPAQKLGRLRYNMTCKQSCKLQVGICLLFRAVKNLIHQIKKKIYSNGLVAHVGTCIHGIFKIVKTLTLSG
jgi:hypothetical protein